MRGIARKQVLDHQDREVHTEQAARGAGLLVWSVRQAGWNELVWTETTGDEAGKERLPGIQTDSFPISISQEHGPLQGVPFRREKTGQCEDSVLRGARSQESRCIWLGHATIREGSGER